MPVVISLRSFAASSCGLIKDYPCSGYLEKRPSPYIITRSHLKNRILVQGQGGAELQPAGILKYSEELERGPNTEIGPKDIFRMASIFFKN